MEEEKEENEEQEEDVRRRGRVHFHADEVLYGLITARKCKRVRYDRSRQSAKRSVRKSTQAGWHVDGFY